MKIFKIGISDRFVFKREAGKRLKIKTEFLISETPLVLRAGIEPARLLRTLDFESSASTNSATWAKNSGAKVDIFRIIANPPLIFLIYFGKMYPF